VVPPGAPTPLETSSVARRPPGTMGGTKAGASGRGQAGGTAQDPRSFFSPLLFSFSSPSLFFLSSSLSFFFQYLVYSSLFKHLENVITYKSYKPKYSYIIIVINTKTHIK
jgi:hypothetical protein